MENELIMTAEELTEGDVIRLTGDAAVIVSAEPSRAYPKCTHIQYRYLGSDVIAGGYWKNGEMFTRVTNLGVMA